MKLIRRPVLIIHLKNVDGSEPLTTEETKAIESNYLNTKKFISVED